jgi:PPM family protein phosphatase
MNTSAYTPLIAVSTRGKSEDMNQDASYVRQISPDCYYIGLADGVGTSNKSEVSSAIVCKALYEEITEGFDKVPPEGINEGIIIEKFKLLSARIQSEISKIIDDEQDNMNSFKTTLICALDMPEKIILSYVGNGSILHIRGNFNEFAHNHPTHKSPWSASNLLNPHSIWQDGHNALYKYINHRSTEIQSCPTVITITKDNCWFGDIFVLCTDGVHSADQTNIGEAEDGKIWIEAGDNLTKLYKSLSSFFKINQIDITEDKLKKMLDGFLDRIQIEDDSTIAVIITPQSIKYQNKSTTGNNAGNNEY